MKWIDCKERLPTGDKLCIIEANNGGRWQMFFKIEDKRWYWQPNPYSVSGEGIVVKWLDESNEERVFTIEDMEAAYNRGTFDDHNNDDKMPFSEKMTFESFMKEKYNIDL